MMGSVNYSCKNSYVQVCIADVRILRTPSAVGHIIYECFVYQRVWALYE